MNLKLENLTVLSLCAAVVLGILVLVGFQVRAEVSCEAVGGIPVRGGNFPSFVECIT